MERREYGNADGKRVRMVVADILRRTNRGFREFYSVFEIWSAEGKRQRAVTIAS